MTLPGHLTVHTSKKPSGCSLRIGFIIYGSLDIQTGGYLYDRNIVEGLGKLGHEVEVVSLVPGAYLGRLISGFRSELIRRLLAGQFDLLIQDELCHPTLFRVNEMLRQRGGPLLVSLVHHIFSQEQHNLFLNRIYSAVECRYLASVDGFIHNSATTRRVVDSLIPQPKPEVVAYPSGSRLGCNLTMEQVEARAYRTGPLELLFLGNIVSRKGLIPLLEALHGLDERFWRLKIIGDTTFEPGYVTKVKKRILQLGMGVTVHLLGFIEDNKLVEILNTSHIFCMPFAYEGFGMAMLEAMSFGLPALASKTGAAAETVRDDENGYLVGMGERKKVRNVIHELYHDRGKLAELAIQARKTYSNSPDWQDGVAKIDRFLQELTLQRKNSPARVMSDCFQSSPDER